MERTLRYRVEQILGYGISKTAEKRTFPIIDGVIYTDLFEGAPPEGYTPAFNGRRNGMTYFNELHVNNYRYGCYNRSKDVELELSWGSTDFDADIQGLVDWLQDNPPTDAIDDAGVASKKIEDFSVSYRTAAERGDDINVILHEGYGFYIRKPLIISIASEQHDASRYF